MPMPSSCLQTQKLRYVAVAFFSLEMCVSHSLSFFKHFYAVSYKSFAKGFIKMDLGGLLINIAYVNRTQRWRIQHR
jgi:hypothetical protein